MNFFKFLMRGFDSIAAGMERITLFPPPPKSRTEILKQYQVRTEQYHDMLRKYKH